MADSEHSSAPIRRHDEPILASSTYCRRERSAERVDRCPSAARLEPQTASNRSRLEPLPSRAPSAADGQRTASAARSLFGGTTSPILASQPFLPTRAQRGASRPLPVGCPPRTTGSLEPSRLEPPHLAPISSRRTAGSERSAESIRRHDEPHPRLPTFLADESAARSESTAARRLSASNHRQSRTPPASNPRSPHKKRVMPPHFSCGHMTRIFTPFQAHIPHLILPISMLISSAFTLCVSAPTEMTSTPAAAAAASVVSSMPPDASTTAR